MIDCSYYRDAACHSCSLMPLRYQEGVARKWQECAALFPDMLGEVVACDYVVGSRNKAKMAVLGTLEEPLFGFLDGEGRPRDISNCPLHGGEINQLLGAIKAQLLSYKLVPYDITSRRGELKYLLITQSEQSGEIMLRFVLRSTESLPRIKKLLRDQLRPAFANLTVVSVNIQPEPKAVLEGEEEIYLTEATHINAPLAQLPLRLGTRSFFQINSHVAIKLYSRAAAILDEIGCSSLLDLYCGVGAFALFAARPGREVVGVEISAEAIRCASLAAAAIADTTGELEFIAADVQEFIVTNSRSFDAVVVNPPRRGLNQTIIEQIFELNPAHLLYSSCNPITLKRDLEQLAPNYRLREITPFDMFPMTSHLECLAWLERVA